MTQFSNKLDGLKQIWQFDNRWHLLLSRFLFKNERLNIYKYKGLEFVTDHRNGDANGARELLTSEMYKEFLPQMDLSGKPLSILDLGSNNGGFPLLLASEKLPIKKLACVELNPNTFSRMRFNVETNIECEFFAINAAVCGEKRDFQMKFDTGNTANNIYSETSFDEKSIKIEGLTFDEIYGNVFGEEAVDLCKIDVEGAEFEIFETENHQKISKCRNILIEIHHEKNRPRDAVRNRLKNLGFTEIKGEEKNKENAHYVHFFRNSENI